MTDCPGESDAVQAVASLVFMRNLARSGRLDRLDIERVVAAAYPVIAAAVREQAAQDIEARVHPDEDRAKWDSYDRGYAKAGRFAAEIVRGGR